MENHKSVLNVVFTGVTASAFMGWMPDFAALLAVLWYLTQFWDWVAAKRNQKKHSTRRSTDR